MSGGMGGGHVHDGDLDILSIEACTHAINGQNVDVDASMLRNGKLRMLPILTAE